MHFVIIYELKAEGARRAELEEKIESILTPYQHVKRLSSLYIVKISNEQEWEDLRQKFNRFANNTPEVFHYVMTNPNTNIGKYNGILYRGDWDDINNITMLP